MSDMIGHDDAWKAWRRARSGDRLHHAWLLTGRKGLGKAHFARAAASELVIAPGQPGLANHPDILVLEPGPATREDEKKQAEGKPFTRKRNITVDQIRAMQRRLTTRPTLSPYRAIIIDSADDLEKSAVNALLKSLEEPPSGTVFFLVSHRAGGLLPTVRSRCRILRIAALGDAVMDRLLADARPESSVEERRAAREAAHGSPGRALAWLDNDLAPLGAKMRDIVRSGDADLSARGALANALGPRPERERLLATVRLARAVCVEELAAAPPGQRAGLIAAHSALTRFGAELPIANFDPGLAVLQIGGLLASAALPKQGAR